MFGRKALSAKFGANILLSGGRELDRDTLLCSYSTLPYSYSTLPYSCSTLLYREVIYFTRQLVERFNKGFHKKIIEKASIKIIEKASMKVIEKASMKIIEKASIKIIGKSSIKIIG